MSEPAETTSPSAPSARHMPAWLRPACYTVAGLVLLTGGFWLGNHYQIVFTQYRPSIVASSQLSAGTDPLFSQVESLLRTKYLRADQLSDEKLKFGAITGMVAAAGDPYTNFFDPSANQSVEDQLSGNYSGIGAELGYNADKQLVVIAPLKDSPAAKAGIKAGDIIAKIDDANSLTMPVASAVEKIRGKAGTTVTLTILREGQDAQVITITRQTITVNSIDVSYKDNPKGPAGNQEVAYIRLSRFGDTTVEEWDKAVADITSHGAKAVILDVRDNPGGYLQAAIHIGSEFFTDGEIVGQQDAQGNVQKFNVDHAGQLTDVPVVVLINGGSASASEIVSGALKTRNRATLIGENSFGKGSVQQVIDLAKGTSLHVTIAKWLLPDGSNIDKVGIKPTQEVKLTSEDVSQGKDPQLDAAIVVVGEKIK